LKAVQITGIFIILILIGCQTASVKKNGAGDTALKAFHPTKSSLSHLQSRGLMKTGLKPIYPSQANCPKISSAFAARTRGDGSFRNPIFFHGYHGGIDIPVTEGTPILAIADGTLIDKKIGKSIGGISVILQHSPEDTGLPFWIYSQYKHLKKLPRIQIGERVKMGDKIALAGSTGTRGGHYGPEGHSHLHLSAFMSPSKDYKIMEIFIPSRGQWIDPLALYRGRDLNTHSIRSLPGKDKKVRIPHMTTDGKVVPKNSRIIWPFSCTSH